MSAIAISHIELRQNRAGDPIAYIVGTRIRVQDVYVLADYHHRTPDEIAASYPHLTLGQIHAALSYAYDHRDDIVAEMRRADEFVEQMKARTGPGPLAQKLGRANRNGDDS